MPFAVSISLSGLGSNTGPFQLLSNATGSFVVFASGIPKSLLQSPAIYTVMVPDGTTIVRVRSTGTCTTSIDLFVIGGPTTTTTTGLPISSTTSSTTISPTSSTTSSTSTTTISPTSSTTSTSSTTTTSSSSTSTTSTTTIIPPTSTTTSSTSTTSSTTSTSTTTSTSSTTSSSTTTTTTIPPTTTTTSSTTSTTSSSTTTTTAEPPACNCYSLYNPGLPDTAIGIDCNTLSPFPQIPTGQTIYVCSASTPGVVPPSSIVVTLLGDCSVCPTTTTSTTVCTCVESITFTASGAGTITYDDCYGVSHNYEVPESGTFIITDAINCINRFSLSGLVISSIDSYGPCCTPPPTTTSTSTSTTTLEPTTTTTSNCFGYTLDSGGGPASIEWFDCGGSYLTQTFTGTFTICTDGSGYTVTAGGVTVTSSGPC